MQEVVVKSCLLRGTRQQERRGMRISHHTRSDESDRCDEVVKEVEVFVETVEVR
jgi:hypothetical protein